MTVCANFEVPNVKTFYHLDDLEKKVKVKLTTCSKKPGHYAYWMYISSPYLKWLLICGHLFIPLVIMEKLNFNP